MFKALTTVAAGFVSLLYASQVKSASLLQFRGSLVKWSQPETGARTVITYALLKDAITLPLNKATLSPDNCGSMQPFEAITSVSNDISDYQVHSELRSAFNEWQKVAGVTFVESETAVHANIIIGAHTATIGPAFANLKLREVHDGAWSAHGSNSTGQSALTKPFELKVRGLAAEIEQAYICLNSKLPWKSGFDGNLRVYDLRYTFLHEIGHAIGLDHPDRSDSVMGYRYDEKVRSPQPIDIDAAQRLYGPPHKGG